MITHDAPREDQLAYFRRAAEILRQHRPARRGQFASDTDEDNRSTRCICGAPFMPARDYAQSVAEHQAAEIAQAAGHDYPLGATR